MREPSELDEPCDSGNIQALFKHVQANSGIIQANSRKCLNPEFRNSGSLNPRILKMVKACRAASSVAM